MNTLVKGSYSSVLNCQEITLIQAVATRAKLLHQKAAKFTCEEYQVIKRGEYALLQLWKAHQWLIRRLITTYQTKDYSFKNSDLEQEATLAFFDAVTTFDPNKGAKLSSWAYIQIRSRLQKVTLKALHNAVTQVRVKHNNLAKSKLELTLEQDDLGQVDSLLNILTEKQQQVVSLALNDLGWDEIALRLQSTTNAVRMLWSRAVQRLRLVLGVVKPEKQQQERLDSNKHQYTQETKGTVFRSSRRWIKPDSKGLKLRRLFKQLPKRSDLRGGSFDREEKNLAQLNGLKLLNLFMESLEKTVPRLLVTSYKTSILNSLLFSSWNLSPFTSQRLPLLTKKTSSIHFSKPYNDITSQKSPPLRFLRGYLQRCRLVHCQDVMKRSFCINPSYSKGVRGSPQYFFLNSRLSVGQQKRFVYFNQ